MPRAKRKRGFAFTSFEDEKVMVKKLSMLDVRYYHYGSEICPETKKTHYQGYMYFQNAQNTVLLRKAFTPNHVDPAGGDLSQNVVYCSKDCTLDDLIVFGEKPLPGRRTDLESIKKMAIEGKSDRELYLAAGSKQAYEMGQIGKALFQKPRTHKTKVIWIYGPSGFGKSYLAYNLFPEEKIFSVEKFNNWYGYEGNRVVVADEFRFGVCSHRMLLKLMDCWPMSVNAKYVRWIEFNSDILIFTTIENLLTVLIPGESSAQLRRRIDVLVEFYEFKKYRFNFGSL